MDTPLEVAGFYLAKAKTGRDLCCAHGLVTPAVDARHEAIDDGVEFQALGAA